MKLKNGTEITIRKAKKADAQAIIEYLNIVGGESDNLTFANNGFHMTVEVEEEYIEKISKSRNSAILIGEIGCEIVCIGSISSSSKERLMHNGEIGVSVLKKYWNIGIGSLLIKEIIAFARENGTCEIIHLSVRSDNITAIELYKKYGFEEIGLYKNYMKINNEYSDVILMNLYL